MSDFERTINRAVEKDRLHKKVDELTQGARCILIFQHEGYMPEWLGFGDWTELEGRGTLDYIRDDFVAAFADSSDDDET